MEELNGKTIMVVDDQPEVLSTVRFTLENKGYNVVTAMDGAQALGKIRVTKPDVVLLDVMMPNIDGYKVLRHIRSNPATNSIPVILVTAKARPEDIKKGYTLGADLYITKPFDLERLLINISAILKNESPPDRHDIESMEPAKQES